MTDRVRFSLPAGRVRVDRSVIVADECPGIVWTDFTDAPPARSAAAVKGRRECVLTSSPLARGVRAHSIFPVVAQRLAGLSAEQPLPHPVLRQVRGQLVHHHRAQRHRPRRPGRLGSTPSRPGGAGPRCVGAAAPTLRSKRRSGSAIGPVPGGDRVREPMVSGTTLLAQSPAQHRSSVGAPGGRVRASRGVPDARAVDSEPPAAAR